jgi:hypothetical protein
MPPVPKPKPKAQPRSRPKTAASQSPGSEAPDPSVVEAPVPVADAPDTSEDGSSPSLPEAPATPGAEMLDEQFKPWKPTGASWREDALAKIAELETLAILLRIRTRQEARSADDLVGSARKHLEVARGAAEHRPGPLRGSTGANVTRVVSNIHAAEAALLRLAPDDYVIGQIPTIQAYVCENLEPKDTRRTQLDNVAANVSGTLSEPQRGQVVSAVREANAEARRKMARVRSFRNVLLFTAGFLLLGAVAIATMGIVDPTAVPLCFTPDTNVVCPTDQTAFNAGADVDQVIARTAGGWDLALVEIIGMIAAAIAAAAALRNIKGTSTPFSLPIALAVLRLPTGALTAVLGLLLMRGQFVPGLSDLDSPAQIVAWAVVFGYAQEIFTRLVDNRAHSVLNDVGSTSPTAQAPAPGT